ncbi:hypothetical protein Tco_0842963 [Tanacetum coccineum]|uniref:Synaptobrevin, longin-like domain protein n=1 Tax=Tanacetum coccineum TaxID=301880 RepID=A0ABQ5B1L9_9ASTR
MTTLKFVDTHNMVAFLSKPEESDGFEQIVDFLNAHPIKYALTVNLILYTSCIEQFWCIVKAKTVNREVQLQALVDGKKIMVTEASIRSDLQLDDEEGMDCLPNATIFEELTRMGYEKNSQKLTFYKAFFSLQWKFLIHTILQCLSSKTTAWNEFSSTMASAIICLATNQKFNFSKYIFESMVKNLENVSGKFLMYPRFVQVFLDKQLEGMQSHKRIYDAPSHTKKIFGNTKRVGKGFSGRVTPLFLTIVVQAQGEDLKTRRPKRKDTEVPQPSGPTTNVADEAVNEEMDDSLVRDATTASSLEAEKDSGNIDKTQSKATPNEPSSPGTSSGGGPRRQKTIGDTIAQTRSEKVSKLSNDPLLARGNTLRSGEDSLKLKELIEFCTTLQTKVLALETIKTTQANEIDNLKRRVKRLKKKDRKITHKLKRLYKVGLTARTDEDMFGVNNLDGDEVIVDNVDADEEVIVVIEKAKLVSAAEETVNAAVTTVSTAITIPVIDVEITLAQALVELTSAKPKPDKSKIVADYQLAQRLQAQEQEELTDAEKARLFLQFLEQRRKHFAAKRAEEKRNRPPTRAQQRSFMCTYLKNMEGWKPKDLKNKSFANIQELFDKAMKRVNTFSRKRKLLKGKSWKKEKELRALQCLEIIPDDRDDVTIDATPLAWIALLHNELHKNHEDNVWKNVPALPLDCVPATIGS